VKPLCRFLIAMAALAGAAVQAQQREVIVWGLGYGPESKGLEALVREFERRNPDLKIRLLSMGAGRMNPQKLMTSIVGNVSPDAIHQDRFTISDWASRGAFQPLDDLIERDRDDPYCPRAEQYYPAPWQEASYEGKVYAIPTQADDRAFYYNRKIFRENAGKLRAAGLDPNRPPRTWSELLAYSRVLTVFNADGTLRRAGFMPNYGNSWLYMYAFQNNAKFMSDDGRRCTLFSPEAEEALNFVLEGYEIVGGYENARAFETGFLPNENDAFIAGKVAMKIDGDWVLASPLSRYAPQLDFGTAPPPVPDDRFYRRGRFRNEKDVFITWAGGHSWAIPTGARNLEGGWRWIKFATSTEGRLIENKAQHAWAVQKGRDFIPKLSGSREANERLYEALPPGNENFAAALKTHMDLLPVARIRPATFAGQRLWDEHVRAMDNACFKIMTPKEALLTAQANVQRDLDAFFSKSSRPIVNTSAVLNFGLLLAGMAAVGLILAYRRKRLGPLARHEARWAYVFVSPWVVGFVVFTAGPMLASLFISFTQYDVLNEMRFVGIRNYAEMVGVDRISFAKAWSNVAYLAGVGVPLSVVTGLSIAILLNGAARGMRFYRTLFYMPAIVPTVAASVLWIWLLASDPTKGLINGFWSSTISQWFGTAPPGWLHSEAWAKPSLILMGVWGAGSGMILWLAGLKGVPGQLYEAACLDGASTWAQFWNVTLPMLSPIVFFNTVMGFIGALQEFDRIYVMRPSDGSAGPADSLLVPVYHLFDNGFSYFKVGYASALAWAIFVIILILTLIQFKLAPRWVHYESER
jgi:multiple sugar transport system permease protein